MLTTALHKTAWDIRYMRIHACICTYKNGRNTSERIEGICAGALNQVNVGRVKLDGVGLTRGRENSLHNLQESRSTLFSTK